MTVMVERRATEPVVRVARADPSLTAVVTAQTPLFYAEGACPASDRPSHVRAGSSLARVPGGIAVVQDDANFIAVIDASRRVSAIELPAGPEGRRLFDDSRGNKAQKLDLEACVAIESPDGSLLLAFGSGSSPVRRRIVCVEWPRAGEAPSVSLIDADALYESLERATDFAGSQLNVEGAVRLGDRLRLFGRGNGRGADILRPRNATCDLDLARLLAYLREPTRQLPPAPTAIVQYDLGSITDVPLGFTDATAWRDRLLFTASAERTEDATRDGPVTGSAMGVIGPDEQARWCMLTDPYGDAYAGKVEGVIAPSPDHSRLLAVVDADDPTVPSLLCDVELRGSWAP